MRGVSRVVVMPEFRKRCLFGGPTEHHLPDDYCRICGKVAPVADLKKDGLTESVCAGCWDLAPRWCFHCGKSESRCDCPKRGA